MTTNVSCGPDVPQLRQVVGAGELVTLDHDVTGLDNLVQGGAVAVLGGGANELERHNRAPFSQVGHQHAGDAATTGAGCARLRADRS